MSESIKFRVDISLAEGKRRLKPRKWTDREQRERSPSWLDCVCVHAIADGVICDKWLGVADSDEHSDCNEHERE